MPTPYEATLRELYALSPRGIVPGLERVERALALTGHPERAFEVVHVAGTNGKGSVSFGVFHGLEGPVGLFTSPHLHSFTERFQVRGAPPIDRDGIAAAWSRLRPTLTGPAAPPLTFFETVTVLAFHLFRERGVAIVVLETGLGGRLDSTNVFPRPLACAITRIGLDHTKLLGPDLASVAREKAGILKAGVPAVIGPQRPEAMAVIEAEAARVGAPLVVVRDAADPSSMAATKRAADPVLPPVSEASTPGEPTRASIAIDDADRMTVTLGDRALREPDDAPKGAHQRHNAAVIAATLWTLADRGMSVNVPRGAFEARWPGRLERIEADGTRWLLDAAHNPDGCAALARHLSERVPERPRVLLFGAMADKDWGPMLEVLRPEVDRLVFARSALSRAEDPMRFVERFGGVAADDVPDAMKRAAAGGAVVVVAGSIFLMAEVRARLLGIEADPPIAM